MCFLRRSLTSPDQLTRKIRTSGGRLGCDLRGKGNGTGKDGFGGGQEFLEEGAEVRGGGREDGASCCEVSGKKLGFVEREKRGGRRTKLWNGQRGGEGRMKRLLPLPGLVVRTQNRLLRSRTQCELSLEASL